MREGGKVWLAFGSRRGHFQSRSDRASLAQVTADQQNDEQYCALMATRHRAVSVEIDIGTVAIAELAAAHDGVPVGEWIARAARREFARPAIPSWSGDRSGSLRSW
ncbi:MAG: hypothetical protein M3460_06655 [Actinomycetota bacterium]|nr:hypothetical protein [Actinomycetota bacterium]